MKGKRKVGANICGPHTLHKEGGTAEGRSSRERPWNKAEMWFPCDGCHRPALGRQPSRDQKSSGFWMFRQKCLIAPSAFIPDLCRKLKNAGADPALLEIPQIFSLYFDILFLSFVFIGLVTIQTTWRPFQHQAHHAS